MTFFQILTRYVATGKRRVTQKLLSQVPREIGCNPCSKPPAPRKRKNNGVTQLCCSALAAVSALPIFLGTEHAGAVLNPLT